METVGAAAAAVAARCLPRKNRTSANMVAALHGVAALAWNDQPTSGIGMRLTTSHLGLNHSALYNISVVQDVQDGINKNIFFAETVLGYSVSPPLVSACG
jgi:hypothetical protein